MANSKTPAPSSTTDELEQRLRGLAKEHAPKEVYLRAVAGVLAVLINPVSPYINSQYLPVQSLERAADGKTKSGRKAIRGALRWLRRIDVLAYHSKNGKSGTCSLWMNPSDETGREIVKIARSILNARQRNNPS